MKRQTPSRYFYRERILGLGAVGYWPLDEQAATLARDESANAGNGTFTGGYTMAGLGNVKAVNAAAVILNGSSGYVSVPHASALAITGDLTCEIWAYPTSSLVYNTLITKTNGATAASWDWYMQSSDNKTRVFLGNGSSSSATTGTTAPTINAWNHIAFTVSGTTVTHYLNGEPNGSATNSSTRGDSGTAIRIGSRNDSGIWFAGRLCDAAIYNRALAADELALNYKIGSGQATHTQRYFFAAAMDAAAIFNPTWAVGRSRILGGSI